MGRGAGSGERSGEWGEERGGERGDGERRGEEKGGERRGEERRGEERRGERRRSGSLLAALFSQATALGTGLPPNTTRGSRPSHHSPPHLKHALAQHVSGADDDH